MKIFKIFLKIAGLFLFFIIIDDGILPYFSPSAYLSTWGGGRLVIEPEEFAKIETLEVACFSGMNKLRNRVKIPLQEVEVRSWKEWYFETDGGALVATEDPDIHLSKLWHVSFVFIPNSFPIHRPSTDLYVSFFPDEGKLFASCRYRRPVYFFIKYKKDEERKSL